MADKRFFDNQGPYKLKDIASLFEGEISAEQENVEIRDIETFEKATSEDLIYFDNKKHKEAILSSKAKACLTTKELSVYIPQGMIAVICKDARLAFALTIKKFYPEAKSSGTISDKAIISESAKIGKNVEIKAGAVIDEGAIIGDNSKIGYNTVIGRGVEIGEDADIDANVTLSHCIIGKKVRILPGARIGQEGFGFIIDMRGGHKKYPQLGRVIIGDDVEIGANTTIDRGALGDTKICSGARLDNLIQIGHNVVIGDKSVLVSQTGIAGSTELEPCVVCGGQSGLAGHIRIGMGSQIGAQCGVLQDLPALSKVMGSPAVPIRQFFRQQVTLEKLAKVEKKTDEV